MDEIDIKDLAEENIEDLCQVCMPPNKRHHPDCIKGVAEKKKWAVDMLGKWGSFAKVACQGGTPVGMIQYEGQVLFSVLRLHIPRRPSARGISACQYQQRDLRQCLNCLR